MADAARRLAGTPPILVLAGPGNNGGDAWVAARHLAGWGHDVQVATYGEAGESAAAAMRARWHGDTVALDAAEPRPLLIDGLFGTGLSRALDDAVATSLARLLAAADFTLAIDLPSGVGTDSGELRGLPSAVHATIALGALKPAHVLNPAVGHVLLADLGIPIATNWFTARRPVIAPPAPDANKYRATVVVAAGAMPGAGRLAAQGAARAGAGYVILAGQSLVVGPLDAIVHRGEPFADILVERPKAVGLVGPGLGRDTAAHALVAVAASAGRNLLLDADALTSFRGEATALAGHLRDGGSQAVLTPHEGEFARMFDTASDKITATIAAARASGATIVHKGHATVIADPTGAVTVSQGSSWLATAGTGDVLAGAIAARLADGGEPADGVWLHADAARRAGPAFAADDLPRHLAAALATCR